MRKLIAIVGCTLILVGCENTASHKYIITDNDGIKVDLVATFEFEGEQYNVLKASDKNDLAYTSLTVVRKQRELNTVHMVECQTEVGNLLNTSYGTLTLPSSSNSGKGK